MSNILYKSYNLCFSKFMCFPTIALSPPPPSAAAHDQDHKLTAATRPLFKNFNSLYDPNSSNCSTSTSSTTTAAPATTSDFSDEDSVPDFASAFASHRFFFSSPGTSNSIFSPPEPPPPPAALSGGVAVQAYSPDPFSDFRKSMVEMIDASGITDVKSDWEFLTELLFCYLTLNPKHAHKFIVGAFADVVVSLVTPPGDGCREIRTPRRRATADLSI